LNGARKPKPPSPPTNPAEGMAVVPVIPTEEMLDAYWDQTGESREMRARTHVSMRRYYAAMLAVAPLANPRRENDK